MFHASARRLLAGLGVAGALVAAAPAPASAAPGDADLALYAFDVIAPIGAPAGTPFEVLTVAGTDITVEDPVFVYDLSGLDGVATAAIEDGDCKRKSKTIVCARPFSLDISGGMSGLSDDVTIRAAAGAKPGATGTLTVTLSGSNLEPVTTDSTVIVAEGVDLTAGPDTAIKAAPGQDFTTTSTVRNTGGRTVDGLAVILDTDRSFRAAERYRNCTYAGDLIRTCTFDQELAEGETLRLSLPYRLGADTLAPGREYGNTNWLTAAEYTDFTTYMSELGEDIGEPGDGGVLTLAAARVAAAKAPQSDVNPDDNWNHVQLTVTGKNGANFAAIGDTVTGSAGDVVTATVGAVNKGPAAVDWSRSGEPIAWTSVTVPAGTTAVEVPDVCIPTSGNQDWGTAGAKAYTCRNRGYVVEVGKPQTYDFKLRIDTVIANATGAVEVNKPCECSQFDGDTDRSDDTAALVVNPGGSGGAGGGLPVTGPTVATAAAGGLVLLAGGAAGVLLARRRRTRFVA